MNIILSPTFSIDIEGRYMMVFDYADNGSLRKYLSTPAIELDWSDNCQLGLDIVNGLRYIHRVGILHKYLVSVLFINTMLHSVNCILINCSRMFSQVFEQCVNSRKDG